MCCDLQAGAACVCRSAAWDAKIVTSAWWVGPDQARLNHSVFTVCRRVWKMCGWPGELSSTEPGRRDECGMRLVDPCAWECLNLKGLRDLLTPWVLVHSFCVFVTAGVEDRARRRGTVGGQLPHPRPKELPAADAAGAFLALQTHGRCLAAY